MNLLFEGNKIRNQKIWVSFKEFNNDFVNKEQEEHLEKHFIDWFKFVNNLPDSDEEAERDWQILANFMGQTYVPKKKKKKDFFLMNFPWIFDASGKTRILRIEAKI